MNFLNICFRNPFDSQRFQEHRQKGRRVQYLTLNFMGEIDSAIDMRYTLKTIKNATSKFGISGFHNKIMKLNTIYMYKAAVYRMASNSVFLLTHHLRLVCDVTCYFNFIMQRFL